MQYPHNSIPLPQLNNAGPNNGAQPYAWFVLPPRNQDSEHPFVEISDSIYLLARLSIALYLMLVIGIKLYSAGSADSLFIPKLLLQITSVLISTLPLWMRFKSIGLFHPLYIISGMSFLRGILPSIANAAYELEFHPAIPEVRGFQFDMLQIQVASIVVLNFLCVYFSFFSTRGIRWRFLGFRKRKNLLTFTAIAGFTIGTVSLYLLSEASGGLSDHLKNINVGVNHKVWVKYFDYIPIFSQLARLIILAPALWVLTGKNPFANPLFWLLCVFAISGAFLTNGRRTSILLTTLVLVACWVLRRGSLALGRMAIIGILLFLMIGLVGEFRKSNWGKQRGVNLEGIQEQDLQSIFENSSEELASRSSASAIYPIVAKVPRRVPYRYGSIYFSYLYRFIPRSIWKNKPPGGIGHDCAQIFYGTGLGVGIPPGPIGEAYWSFGYIGVVLVFCFWGWCLRSLANFFIRFRSNPFASILYLATIVMLNPSEPGFRAWLYLVGPMIFGLLILGAMRFAGPSNSR